LCAVNSSVNGGLTIERYSVTLMKKIEVEAAVGMVLAHDITKVIPGEFKGIAFRKGHIIEEQDVEKLKDIGKFHVFVFELSQNELHENDAAKRLGLAVSGKNIRLSEEKEGKVDLISTIHGRFTLSLEGLEAINQSEGIILATRHRDSVVNEGDVLAGAKIIPLVIQKKEIERIEAYTDQKDKIMRVIPFSSLKVGILITGSEVFYHRIEDKFAPVLEKKVEGYGGIVVSKRFAPDDLEYINSQIIDMLNEGYECIILSGGMSVDPDDLTPTAIASVATEVITYGSPVLPGAMFMMAYHENTPIIGVPACGMFNKITVLDLILPYIFTKEKVTSKIIKSKAHGGLCLKCQVCVYPHCEFGKG